MRFTFAPARRAQLPRQSAAGTTIAEPSTAPSASSTNDCPANATPATQECLLEYATSAGLQPRVDAVRGVLHGVKVLGPRSRNGRVYQAACIEAAAPLYEGIKVNVNHSRVATRAPRDYQDRLGCLRDVRADAAGLFADLHFNPRHAVAEQLIWDARHAPENVGLSHNVQARTSRAGHEVIVEEIVRVNCVDLVADPATTRGLFESLEDAANEPSSDDLARLEFLLEELLRRRPELLLGRTTVGSRHLATPPLELQPDVLTPEFQALLEDVQPDLAEALRRERIAWQRQPRTGRPKCRPATAPPPQPAANAQSWVKQIT